MMDFASCVSFWVKLKAKTTRTFRKNTLFGSKWSWNKVQHEIMLKIMTDSIQCVPLCSAALSMMSCCPPVCPPFSDLLISFLKWPVEGLPENCQKRLTERRRKWFKVSKRELHDQRRTSERKERLIKLIESSHTSGQLKPAFHTKPLMRRVDGQQKKKKQAKRRRRRSVTSFVARRACQGDHIIRLSDLWEGAVKSEAEAVCLLPVWRTAVWSAHRWVAPPQVPSREAFSIRLLIYVWFRHW